MAREIISTGNRELDKDLKVLFEAEEANQLEELSKPVSKCAISEEELSKAIPEPILRLAYVLSDAQFAVIRSSVEEKSRPILDDAKRLDELTASLHKIRKLLPIYGIDPAAAKDDEFGEEVSKR